MSTLMVGPLLAPGRDRVPRVRRVHGLRTVKIGLSLLVATALLVGALPKVAGEHWAAVAVALRQVSMGGFIALTALWVESLVAHTFVLSAALPGLSKRRAMVLRLTGSSVSNALPFGGAVGTALNYSMTRRWGHSRAAFVLFALVTHIWGVAAKLCLPVLALVALLFAGGSTGALVLSAGIAVAVLGLFGIVLAMTIAREDVAAALGRLTGRFLTLAARVTRRPAPGDLAVAMRRDGIALVRGTWRRSAAGIIAYSTLQGLLLWACLALVGASVNPAQVLAAFALERLLSVVVITPGGLGVVEVGMTSMLVAFGGAPAAAAAGVLLFRAFTFALEIPVGATLLLGWLGMTGHGALPAHRLPVAVAVVA